MDQGSSGWWDPIQHSSYRIGRTGYHKLISLINPMRQKLIRTELNWSLTSALVNLLEMGGGGGISITRVEVFGQIFARNAVNTVKKIKPPRFTAFTAKRRKKYAVKILFSPYFTHFLQKFTAKTRPGNSLTFVLQLDTFRGRGELA